MTSKPKPGSIGWIDLTVDDADGLRDFYAAVAGWQAQPVSMGAYSDYCMAGEDDVPVSGICHRRGPNSELPGQWLIYIVVEDLEAAMAACTERQGEILTSPREVGGGSRVCVIRDPAGAVAALYEAG
jgi:predicted enzyme related to lactoylglutathione lyase